MITDFQSKGNEKNKTSAYVLRDKLYLCQYRRVESVNDKEQESAHIRDWSVKLKESFRSCIEICV